jgi:SagB-type dehydrogenase family enzyme
MFLYKLCNDVQLNDKYSGCYMYSQITERYVHWKTEQPLTLINTLKQKWLNEDDMVAMFSPAGDEPDWPTFYYFFDKLLSANFLVTCFSINDEPVFTVSPAPNKSVYETHHIKPDTIYRLSRFALIRQDDGEMVLECALTKYRFFIHKKELSELMFRLCSGLLPDHTKSETIFLLAALLSKDIIEVVPKEKKEKKHPLDVWEFHDLLFYSRSQKGRHLFPIGGTYRFADKRKSPPVVKPIVSDRIVPLEKPDGILSDNMVQPFNKILESRRSLRKYAKTPITLDELAAFLFYSSRIQQQVNGDFKEDIVSLRPSPSGGARHALEIYPFVRECENCAPGIYRYCPQDHALEKIKSSEFTQSKDLTDESIKKLLDWNPHKVISTIPPHVTIYISARFERMSWKYESIAYKLIQQDLGCLYQTFYLVTEALGMAGCALGDIDTVALGKILDIDWQSEPFIGGFTLGKRE